MIDHCYSAYEKNILYCWSLLIICHFALYTVISQALQLFVFISNSILHHISHSHSHLTDSTIPSWYRSEEQIFTVQELGDELLKYMIAYKPYGGVHKEIRVLGRIPWTDFLAVSAYISNCRSRLFFKLLSLFIDGLKSVLLFAPPSLHSSPPPRLL